MDRTPSRLHGRSESSPKHFSIDLYSPVNPPASAMDLSSKIFKQVRIRAHILRELNMQAQNPMQIIKEHRTCAYISRGLNMQAQILYNTELLHISYGN